MATMNVVDEALVPYYRQILPSTDSPWAALSVVCAVNLGDGIEYSQRRRENLD